LIGRKLKVDLESKVLAETDNLLFYLYTTANQALSKIDNGIKSIKENIAAKTDTLAEFA
jgi:hypothetical protein